MNRVVDITSVIDQKVVVNQANVTQGPAGENGARLRSRLAAEKRRLPILGNDDETANRQYIKQFVLWQDADLGRRHGLSYAEPFHYVGPDESPAGGAGFNLQEYIQRNAVPL